MIIDKHNPNDRGEIERQEYIVVQAPENIYVLIKYSDVNEYFIERVWAFSAEIFVFSKTDIENPKYNRNPSFDRLGSRIDLNPIVGGSNFSDCGINDELTDDIVFIGTKEECEKEKENLEKPKAET